MNVSAKRWLRILAVIVTVPALLAVTSLSYLYVSQESMIFPGTPLPSDFQFEFDLPFEERTVVVDGAEINALHFQQPDPRGLIFFLHGNGGNLESWTENAEYYQRVNYDLFIFDYRGYGKSTGNIDSEEQLHADVRAAWDTVAERYTDKSIVIYGRSLGTALAARLATEVDSDLLILVSPFTSVVSMARRQYPFIPDGLVRYPLRTEDIIDNVEEPIVFAHGDRDRLIPIEHSFALRERVSAPSKMLIIEGAGHNDIHRFRTYLDGLTAELNDLFALAN